MVSKEFESSLEKETAGEKYILEMVGARKGTRIIK